MEAIYGRFYLHVIFAVSQQHGLIAPFWEKDLYQYITGIIQRRGQKLIMINGMPDHIHLLLSLQPDCSIQELVQTIKSDSSKWIIESGLVDGEFQWQEGYGAFSISDEGIGTLCDHLGQQKQFHARVGMREEYIAILNEHGVEFDDRGIFEDPE